VQICPDLVECVATDDFDVMRETTQTPWRSSWDTGDENTEREFANPFAANQGWPGPLQARGHDRDERALAAGSEAHSGAGSWGAPASILPTARRAVVEHERLRAMPSVQPPMPRTSSDPGYKLVEGGGSGKGNYVVLSPLLPPPTPCTADMIKEYHLLKNTERLALSTAASVNESGPPSPEPAIAAAERRKLAPESDSAWSRGLEVCTGPVTSSLSDSPTWWVMYCAARRISSSTKVTHVPLHSTPLPRNGWQQPTHPESYQTPPKPQKRGDPQENSVDDLSNKLVICADQVDLLAQTLQVGPLACHQGIHPCSFAPLCVYG